MMAKFNRILIFVLVLSFASFASADILTLKDGTVYEGVITKETRAQVIIEITIANIKTTKTFPRYKVKSIEHKPIESTPNHDDSDTQTITDDSSSTTDSTKTERPKKNTTPRKRTPRASAAPRDLYIIIPVHGMIGEETNANGLRNALKLAAKKKIKHIVFTIDSPGGYVYDAVETLKVLKEFDDALTYHALVEEGAISAASVYVAAADNIFVRPDARVGGAVAYSEDNSSGAAEVDAKFNSIWAAEIAARAESKGHPPEIFRAMVVLEAEVWIDEDGKVFPSRPRGSAKQIDSRSTILTIRAGQMIRVGMAKEFEGKVSELGELLELENWSEVRTIGSKAMSSSAKARIKLADRLKIAVDYYLEKADELKENDPRAHSDYRYYINPDRSVTDYIADGPSLTKWRRRSQQAVHDCDMLLEALREIASVNIKAEKLGALHLGIPNSIGDDAFDIVSKLRGWFRANSDFIPSAFLEGDSVGP